MSNKKILYLLGASASGKTSVAKELSRLYSYDIIQSVTTRCKRNVENLIFTDFFTEDLFKEYVQDNKFIESNYYAGNYYGTLYKTINKVVEQDTPLYVKIIDVNGLKQIIQSGFHENENIGYYVVCIKPDYSAYNDRLQERDSNGLREADDKKQYELFKKEVPTFVDNDKYSTVFNNCTLAELVNKIHGLNLESESQGI